MTVEELVKGLTEAQRKFVLNTSKRPKKWRTIRRHAKIPNTVRVHGLARPLGLLDHGPNWREGYFLTPLGLAVRAHIEGSSHDR